MSDDTKKAMAPIVTTVVAVVMTGVYLAAAWWITDTFALHKPPEGSNWDRAWGIFSGIQSIGFAAVGILLGTTVQQVRVTEARADADKAKSAIKTVIKTTNNELGGGHALPKEVVDRLQDGL